MLPPNNNSGLHLETTWAGGSAAFQFTRDELVIVGTIRRRYADLGAATSRRFTLWCRGSALVVLCDLVLIDILPVAQLQSLILHSQGPVNWTDELRVNS